MARVRFIGPESVTVPELGGREIEPDQLVTVPDERYWGYICQPSLWEGVEEPPGFVHPDADKQPQQDAAPPAQERAVPTAPQETAAPAARSARRGAAAQTSKEDD
ncbi:hypothetical protein ACFY3G_17860 [Streptomyces phaeochromogenes]|uniref:hypothetical protein n=1 Tax=Streptomyces phaeochromogenes TaxID=1923 RepID=UPI0036C4F7B9